MNAQILIAIATLYFVFSSGSILPVFGFLFLMVLIVLVHLILNQEKMLYVPDPMQGQMLTPEQNPQGFRAPSDLCCNKVKRFPCSSSMNHGAFPHRQLFHFVTAQSDLGLRYENLWIATADAGKVHAWWMDKGCRIDGSKEGGVPAATGDGRSTKIDSVVVEGMRKRFSGKSSKRGSASNKNPVFLFCHANAGNMGLRMPNFAELHSKIGASVLAFDYRGYGHSKGRSEENGLILDGLGCLAYLKQELGVEECYLFGRSLGGAVAVALAQKIEALPEESSTKYPTIKGLVLENTFTSIPHLADKLFPFLKYLEPLKKMFMRIKWETIKRIPDVQAPILIIQGEKDELIPLEHSALLQKAARNAELVYVPDGTHNDTYAKGGENYWASIKGFVEKCAD